MNFTLLCIISLGWGSLLPKATYVTNNFGTYRPGRFHTGIDFSTHGRIGIPLRTPFKSRVWRVFTSYYGYGKALYMKTPSDNIVVLAHLSKFSQPLEDYIYSLQISKKSYFVNYFPSTPVLFNRGDVVVYTGKSGVGSPHLHLEVRTNDNRPINPLFFIKIKDTRPPEITALRIIPRSKTTVVDSSLWGREYSSQNLKHLSKRKYIVQQAINVSGPFGVEIKAVDYMNGSPYPLLPYKILTYLDKNLVYQIQFDTLDFTENWLSPIVFAYEGGSYSKAWIRLYRYGSKVPRMVKSSNKYFTIKDSDTLSILVYDFAGNYSSLKVPLKSDTPGNFQILNPSDAPDYKDSLFSLRLNPYHCVVILHHDDGFIFKKGEFLDYDVSFDSMKIIEIKEPGLYHIGSDDTPLLFKKLSPAGGSIRYKDWIVSFPEYSVPESTWIFIKEVAIDIPPGLSGSGNGIVIIGGRMPLLKKFKIVHGENGDLYRIGKTRVIYSKDGGSNWGIYAFLEDTTLPTIKVMSKKKVLARVIDNQSGIDARSLEVFIDNQWIPASYDPDNGVISFNKGLSPKRHKIEISIRDNAGNKRQVNYTIRP